MWETPTNFEKVLDADQKEGLQLPEGEKAFESKFKDKANRLTLVNTAAESFAGLDQKAKDDIKAKAKTEISSRTAFPNKDTDKEAYGAKIAVLYLYTTLDKGTTNASMDDVKAVYEELKAADAKDKAETTAKLETSKKEATGALTTKLEEYTKSKESYSDANRTALNEAKKTGDENIALADTPDKVTTAKDNALTAMGDVPTVEKEKAAELTQSVNDKTVEQEESTKNTITYVEQDGKRWHYENQELDLVSIPTARGWLAYKNENLTYKNNTFVEDQTLNDFMASYEKNESPFYTANAEMFNYLAKNYPSFSKNNDINSKVNAHIADYLENDNTNRDYPDLRLQNKEITGVTLKINPDSGLYYFDIPRENLNKSTLKKYPEIKSIHLYSQEDMWDNVIINEEDKTKPTTVSVETKIEKRPGYDK